MDKKTRKVDPNTFWRWLTNEVEVGNRKGVLDSPIPQSNNRAWMGFPDPSGSEIIIPVYDGYSSVGGMAHQCGRISFRFSETDNEKFDIVTGKNGPQYISDYYEKDLLPKIETKFPALPRTKLGRRHFPEDVWAHNEVCQKGRDKKDVEKEWLKRIEGNRNYAYRASSQRHFRRIISPKWEK